MDDSVSTLGQGFDQPRLPPELECLIFEIAALSRPTTIPALMRVAWRVKHWVEPLLYRVIFLSSYSSDAKREGFPAMPLDILLNTISKKPALFFESSVTHVFLGLNSEDGMDLSLLELLLAVCPHIENLFLSDTSVPEYLPLVSQLQSLVHLTMELRPLFPHRAIDFSAPLFRNVTHLELLDDCDILPSDTGSSLALIPNLTHVAFNAVWGDVAAMQALHARIRTDACLRCIVFFRSDVVLMGGPDFEDIRCMCIVQSNFRADWLRGAATGDDYWALAEAFIAAKQAGKVDRYLYCIDDSDESWRM
ncbi:hypothetical protein B0H19DRAFT_1104528 [Mycena capillaripes]|nr:hypothetical protein B0H19DRAFT_1104528 [Mycena capillaripes]